MTRSILAAVLALPLLAACGASAPANPETAASVQTRSDDGAWTDAHLRRLDPTLRAQVERGTTARLAIKVYFSDTPSDDELSELLLSRVGRQIVGQVQLAMLHRIADRDDVEHIEALNDVGY
ncbi:MAG: hypothetical protein H6719_36325 [Sandaracinaceae bacterium]|nr:hypothetical protein [Sandaracinaceae bacterium]